ncbi:MAG: leucine-rich repeat domain-containing protein [Chlamydiota bacterium]
MVAPVSSSLGGGYVMPTTSPSLLPSLAAALHSVHKETIAPISFKITMTYSLLNTKLEDWVKSPDQKPGELRRAAKNLILHCFQKKLPELKLKCHLSGLPPELGHLIHLKKLDISDNILESLPSNLGFLANLQELTLHTNSLSTLPQALENCKALTWMDISSNNFRDLPAWIANFTTLERLNLNDNPLSFLPDEFFTRNLTECRIDAFPNNFSFHYITQLSKRLSQLTLGGYRIADIDFIDEENPESLEALAAGQALAVALPPGIDIDHHDLRPTLNLEDSLYFWKKTAAEVLSPLDLWDVLEEYQEDLSKFLTKKAFTASFQIAKPLEKQAVAQQVLKVLRSMTVDENFRENVMDIIGQANSGCHDRTAYYFGKIAVSWEIYVGSKKKTVPEIAALIVGMARMAMIEEKAALLGGPESVETALRLQIALKERLRLPFSDQKMHHSLTAVIKGTSSKEQSKTIKAIGLAILESTCNPSQISKLLITNPIWINFLQKADAKAAPNASGNTPYEQIIEKATYGKYLTEDLRQADLDIKLDAAYLGDTRKWLGAYFEELKSLIFASNK